MSIWDSIKLPSATRNNTALKAGGFDNSGILDWANSFQPSTNPRFIPPTPTSVPFKLNGNTAYKTPSGSTWEYKPDGTRIVHLASVFGGGSYSVNLNNPNQVINQGHTSYGGLPPKPGFERNDIIPVSLGGVNSSPDNLAYQPFNQANPQDQMEKQLAKDVKNGNLNLAQARLQMMNKNTAPPPPGFWQQVGSVLGDVGRGLKTGGEMIIGKTENTDTFQNPITATINLYKKPSEMVQQAEASVPNVPVLHQAAQAILRTIVPIAEGFGTIVGGDILGQRELANQTINNKTTQTIGKQVQSNIPTNLVVHKVTPQEILNIALNSIQVGLLISPFITKGARTGAIKLADTISENAKVSISFEDMQKITSSTSDAEAIARVGQEKFNAYKEAANNNTVRQSLKQGYVELATKEPNTFANIIRNAATRPITEIGNIGKQFGTNPAEGIGTKLLPQEAGQTPETLPTETSQTSETAQIPEPNKILSPTINEQGRPLTKAEGGLPSEIAPNASVEPQKAQGEAITPKVGNITSETTKSQNPNKTSGVAKSVETKAIEANLTKGFPDKAGFESSTFKEQVQKIADLMNSGIDNARAVVRGDVPMPEGLKAAPLMAEMERYAKENPKDAGAIMHELANSHLATTISTGASETSFARMREQDSATAKLAEIRKAKVEKAGGEKAVAQKKTAVVKQLTDAMTKVNLPKEEVNWDKFLNDIQC